MDELGKSLCLSLRNKLREVYTGLGKGYPECVYQKAFGVELQELHIPYDMEVTMSIPYKQHIVGQVRADIILRGSPEVVIETKATANPLKLEERWQLARYMKILGISIGALVNFPQVATATEPQMEFFLLVEDQVYLYNVDTGVSEAPDGVLSPCRGIILSV
jgi:GxxExxY protein